jgi:hypothetical protein
VPLPTRQVCHLVPQVNLFVYSFIHVFIIILINSIIIF